MSFTELPYNLLKNTFNKFPITNERHFAKHVMRLIATAAKKEAPGDEHRMGDNSEKNTFFDKCILLINDMIQQDTSVEVFQALVVLKSVLHEKSLRVASTECFEKAHQKLDEAIRAFVDDEVPSHARRCSATAEADQAMVNHDKHRCSVAMDGLGWSAGERGEHDVYYDDFAFAARCLRTAYLEQQCTQPGKRCYDPYHERTDDARCFHENSIKLLGYLQERAWSEIRFNVFSTASTLLPTELSEQIFEDALAAEGIPLDPRTHERHIMQSQWDSFSPYYERPRRVRRLKEELRCPRKLYSSLNYQWDQGKEVSIEVGLDGERK
jgi:hypothetical protein